MLAYLPLYARIPLSNGTLGTWDIWYDGDRSAVEQGGMGGFRKFGWNGTWDIVTWQLAPKREGRWPEEGHGIAMFAFAILSIQ